MLAERELHRKRLAIGAEWNVFHPRIRATQRWSRGRVRQVVRPYLNGYIFIQFDLTHYDWPRINWTVGLKELIYCDAEKPARIADKAMAFLMGLCTVEESEGIPPVYYIKEEEADSALLEVGRTVRWQPSWLDVPVEREIVWTAGERLRVLMQVFGVEREVELKKKDVELI